MENCSIQIKVYQITETTRYTSLYFQEIIQFRQLYFEETLSLLLAIIFFFFFKSYDKKFINTLDRISREDTKLES